MITDRSANELKRLRDRYRDAANKIDDVLKAISQIESSPQRIPEPIRPKSTLPISEGAEYSFLTQKEGVYDVLKAARKPMTREEIFEVFTSKGGRAKNSNVLAPLLSRDERIACNGRRKWFLKQTELQEIKEPGE